MDLIDEIGFDTSFSFIYSARPGTPAAGLVDEDPETTKKAWLQTLQARIRDQADAISQAMVGTEQRVLVMNEAKKGVGQLAARTENNRVVNFAGSKFVDRLFREGPHFRSAAQLSSRNID